MYIYQQVFFAINMLSKLIQKKEKEGLERNDTQIKEKKERKAKRRLSGEYSAEGLASWESLCRKRLAGDAGEEMLLQFALQQYGAEDDDDPAASDQVAYFALLPLFKAACAHKSLNRL